MPNYCRYRVPGGTYFSPQYVGTKGTKSQWLTTDIDTLRAAIKKTKERKLFHIDA